MFANTHWTTLSGTQSNLVWLVLFLLAWSDTGLMAQTDANSQIPIRKIELVNSPNGHVVDFHGLSADEITWAEEILAAEKPHVELAKRFPVSISTHDEESPPAIIGKYLFTGSSLRFQPRFTFQKGANYLAKYLVEGAEPHELSFSIPVQKTEPARVTQVYPTNDLLPENLLKFYVHFSAPMRHGNIYEHVRIERKDGTLVDLPFLEIDQELWSRDGLRLTLLLDPGRIKRGLKPREEMGPIFETGESYRLVISDKWFDANGNPLAAEHVKSFSVGDVDEEQPNPRRWRIEVPNGQTRDAVVMTLDEACDSALLLRIFQIENPFGNEYLKSVELDENEKVVRFYPREPWWPGMYNLKVAGILEDLCGNSVEKKFDIDVFHATRESSDFEMTEIEFEIK